MVEIESLQAGLFYYDIIVVILAICANALVLVAVIRPNRSVRENIFYRTFLISLSVCDLFTATVNLSSMIYQQVVTSPEIYQSIIIKCGANVLRTLQLSGFFINLLNLSAMSLDNFFSVICPIKYLHAMNKHVAHLTFAAIWIFSFALVFLDIPISVATYYYGSSTKSSAPAITPVVNETSISMLILSLYGSAAKSKSFSSSADYALEAQLLSMSGGNATKLHFPGISTTPLAPSNNSLLFQKQLATLINDDAEQDDPASVCTVFSVSKMWLELCVITLVGICFLILTICYSAVFRKVAKRFDASGRRARRLTLTTLIFIGAFTVCWLPFMTFEFSTFLIFQNKNKRMSAGEQQDDDNIISKLFILQGLFHSIMLTYQLLDPLIYAARVPTVAKQFLALLSQFPCCQGLTAASLRQRGSTDSTVDDFVNGRHQPHSKNSSLEAPCKNSKKGCNSNDLNLDLQPLKQNNGIEITCTSNSDNNPSL